MTLKSADFKVSFFRLLLSLCRAKKILASILRSAPWLTDEKDRQEKERALLKLLGGECENIERTRALAQKNLPHGFATFKSLPNNSVTFIYEIYDLVTFFQVFYAFF